MIMKKLRKGATFIEYAMLAGLVAVVVAMAAMFFGDEIRQIFSKAGQETQKVNKGISGVDLTTVNVQSGKNQ